MNSHNMVSHDLGRDLSITDIQACWVEDSIVDRKVRM